MLNTRNLNISILTAISLICTFLFQLFLKDPGVGVNSNLGNCVGASRPAQDFKIIIELCAVPLVVHNHLIQLSFGQVWISYNYIENG